jgi:hypothetical protein
VICWCNYVATWCKHGIDIRSPTDLPNLLSDASGRNVVERIINQDRRESP